MIKFWYNLKWFNYLLIPISLIWQIVTYSRFKFYKSEKVKPLVICIGNITVGGGGKTPFTLYIARELQSHGFKVGILSRGYGGRVKQKILEVNPKIHTAQLVGDEGFLLSQVAPLIISKNRALGAKIFAKRNVEIILMDDGLQNPTLNKDINILLLNTLNPFGNGLIIPAGPLREKLYAAKKRIDVVVGVGKDNSELKNDINNKGLKYISAKIKADTSKINLSNNYLAFASIAYPKKFFNTLKEHNIKVKLYKIFKDHYLYNPKDIEKMLSLAKKHNLRLITTAKDYVKISKEYYHLIDKLDIDLSLSEADKLYLWQLIKEKINYKKSNLI